MIIRFVVLIFLFLPSAYAQDDDDDFFEGDILDEPNEPPSDSMTSRPDFQRPPQIRHRTDPALSDMQGDSGAQNGFAPSDSEVEFRLVDPPKYWQPKKRKRHIQH